MRAAAAAAAARSVAGPAAAAAAARSVAGPAAAAAAAAAHSVAGPAAAAGRFDTNHSAAVLASQQRHYLRLRLRLHLPCSNPHRCQSPGDLT